MGPTLHQGFKTYQVYANMATLGLPKNIEALANEGSVKLFGKWETADVDVKDISLSDYVQVRHAVYLPHTAGRYNAKQFRKSQMPIVERLVCSLMMNGRNKWPSESSCTPSRSSTSSQTPTPSRS